MKKHSFKRIKKRLVFRVLPFILAFLMLLTSAPVAVFSTDEKTGESAAAGDIIYDYDTLKITLDGEEISSMSIYPYEKIEISGTGVPENATYQWQIKHPEKNNLWVNIYDAKSDTIGVSAALINNMLAEDGTAKLRLRAYTDDYAYLSNPVTVTLLEENQTASEHAMRATYNGNVMLASNTSELVSVEIHYIKYEYVEQVDDKGIKTYVLQEKGEAYGAYVATIRKGSDLSINVPNPVIVGYDATLVLQDGQTGAVQQDDTVNITLNNVTEDISFRVEYRPAMVNYNVHYYFQNIYDDLYVENNTLAPSVTKQGYTGDMPDPNVTRKEFDGFTSLFYEPDIIAADGSTVFNVYYERDYYLMEFDCAGGYGTDTVYVRYGTYIAIADPVRPGYVFAGWDLVATNNSKNTIDLGVDEDGDGRKDGDKNADLLPTTMPHYNTAYKALWTTAETTFTTVYWVDGKYLGSREISSTSSNIVNGDDYKLDSSTIICGTDEHNHTTSGCDIVCGIGEHEHHVHESGCYSYITIGNEVTNTGDLGAIEAANQNLAEKDEEPKNGYLYLIRHAEWDAGTTRYWPKAYFDGEYYDIYINDSSSILSDDLKNITVDNTLLVEGTSGQYTAYVYKAKNDCGVDACSADCDKAHTHGTTCFGCGVAEHAHDPATCCANELRFMEFSSADSNVTVEGDGSTIVNINYEYKTYTFRFYYAKEVSGKYYVAGGSTWAFSGAVNDVTEQLEDVDGIWGQVEQLPTLTNTNFNGDTYDVYTVKGVEGNVEGKYYYIELSAKYGTDISTSWPANVFNRVKTSVTHTNGDYAYFSAWNVDANTWYDETYENKTLKGNYQRLDYKLLRHSNYSDSTTLYYLGFWENGIELGDNDWNKPHKWIYNIYIPSTDAEYVHEYNGEKYDLYGTYTLYDDNTSTSTDPYCGQTPTALEGYDVFAYDVSVVEEYDTKYHLYTYQIDFYYKSNGPYSFSLYNYNNTIKTENDMFFGVPLSEHKISQAEMHEIHYPDGLEPGAYEFGGWYTTPGCYDGTEVDWDTLSMPDGDLTLYAKWTPVKRNVYFHLTYGDMQNNVTWTPIDQDGKEVPTTYPIVVDHGQVLGTTYNYTPTRSEDYDNDGEADYVFIGWFYMDEDNKKRFAPDTMEIKRDLHLFAEWQSKVDTKYEVEYVLDADANIGDKVYTAGTPLALITEGHSAAGRTKTFIAKAGEQLLDEFKNAPLFPLTNTHSILMDADPTGNTYTFRYVLDDTVYYRVRYVDKVTGEVLGEKVDVNGSVDLESHNAIVTEKFKNIDGYVPEQFYIRKVLAADGNSTTAIAENVITFYYLPNTSNESLYNVEYYKWNQLTGAYEQVQSEPGRGTVNETVTVNVDSDKFTGFTFKKWDIISYTSESAFTTESGTTTPSTLSETLSEYGLVFKLYYDPIQYPYRIQFVDRDTNEVLGYGKLTDSDVHTLDSIKNEKANFDAKLTYTAPASITTSDNKIYNLIEGSEQTKTLIIRIEQNATDASNCDVNILTFYYMKEVIPIEYHAICTVPEFEGGKVSQTFEPLPNSPQGCDALKYSGFEFVGWYFDEACTQKVPDTWLSDPISTDDIHEKSYIKPPIEAVEKGEDGKEHYYALFKPVVSELKITKDTDNTTCDDTFIFHIVGEQGTITENVDMYVSVTGNSSVVIKELYCGNYTITELTDWSWKYDIAVGDTSIKTIVLTATPDEVTFANTDNNPNWLNGETVNENQFN